MSTFICVKLGRMMREINSLRNASIPLFCKLNSLAGKDAILPLTNILERQLNVHSAFVIPRV